MCYQNMLYQKWHIKLSPTHWPCFLYWLIIVVVDWPSSPLVDRFLYLDILSAGKLLQILTELFDTPPTPQKKDPYYQTDWCHIYDTHNTWTPHYQTDWCHIHDTRNTWTPYQTDWCHIYDTNKYVLTLILTNRYLLIVHKTNFFLLFTSSWSKINRFSTNRK